MSSNYFERINGNVFGSTGTGLDQLVDLIHTDFGLSGQISEKDISRGADAADQMNVIIIEAIQQTGVAPDGFFTTDDVKAINGYIRSNYLDQWTQLHGDDENCEETGYHLVQNDGGKEYFRGKNLVNTVADGIYHLGFEIQGDNILNEDGNENATLEQLAEWLTVFYTDRSTTGSGLDKMVDMILADKCLALKISEQEIAEGADNANALNQILNEAIEATQVSVDGGISVSDIGLINTYIRDNYQAQWAELHGDDEKNGEETGYHLVQNDGAGTRMFNKNFVNTVADGIYHLGFEIDGENILNEDGNKNATLSDLADWVQYFYVDQSTTGTKLDYLVDAIKSDRGLSYRTSAGDINSGAEAANAMNQIIIEAIQNTNAVSDEKIDVDDIRLINRYIRDNHQQEWISLHGDDEDNGEETGFHLVQNDGANLKYHKENLINTVADGIYHLGFEIQGENILNEDGDTNASLADLATWLNDLYLNKSIIYGSNESEYLKGMSDNDEIYGRGGDDRIYAYDGDDEIYGQDGNDQIYGHDGDDSLYGGDGDDKAYGGAGNDVLIGALGHDYLIGGDGDDWIEGGAGDDKLVGDAGNDYLDSGEGNDKIYDKDGTNKIKSGTGDDYISAGKGIDWIDTGDGNDKAYGGGENDTLIGGNGDDYLIGGDGDDQIEGGAGHDKLVGDAGDDYLDSGEGNDTIYGKDGNDTIIAGAGNDYISAGDGVDQVDTGDGDDKAYGGAGNDVLIGALGHDYLIGGDGDDRIEGGAGDDKLVGDAGNDYLDSGEGNDKIYDKDGTNKIKSGTGDDYISAGKGIDWIDTGDGDDKAYGGDENDTLIGGNGDDYLIGGDGDDQIEGGAGDDKLIGDAGDDYLDGGSGDDTLYGKDGEDIMTGGQGNDYLKGYDGNDLLFGGDGDDKLCGYDDNDNLIAGNGSDLLYGGDGDDTLYSLFDASNDEFRGEKGADTFFFSASESGPSLGDDIIKDFNFSQGDKIVIAGEDIVVNVDNPAGVSSCYNSSVISLSSKNGDALGTITVCGDNIIQDDIEIQSSNINVLDMFGLA